MVIYTCISEKRIKFWGFYGGYYEICSFSFLNSQYQIHVSIKEKIVTLRMSSSLTIYSFAEVPRRVAEGEQSLPRPREQVPRSPPLQTHHLFSGVGHTNSLQRRNRQTCTHKPKPVAHKICMKVCISLLQAEIRLSDFGP